jgi:hypothetical protein
MIKIKSNAQSNYLLTLNSQSGCFCEQNKRQEGDEKKIIRAKILKQKTRGEKMEALRGCKLEVQFW